MHVDGSCICKEKVAYLKISAMDMCGQGLYSLTYIIILLVLLLQALTASALSGLRWTLAQILTQKAELGITVLHCI